MFRNGHLQTDMCKKHAWVLHLHVTPISGLHCMMGIFMKLFLKSRLHLSHFLSISNPVYEQGFAFLVYGLILFCSFYGIDMVLHITQSTKWLLKIYLHVQAGRWEFHHYHHSTLFVYLRFVWCSCFCKLQIFLVCPNDQCFAMILVFLVNNRPVFQEKPF